MGVTSSRDSAEVQKKEIHTIKVFAASVDAAEAPKPPATIKLSDGNANGSNKSPVKPKAGVSPPVLPPKSGGVAVNPLIPSGVSASSPIKGAGSTESTPKTPDSNADEPGTPSAAANATDSASSTLIARSSKLTPADFVLLKTIGQGSFGLVLQVRADAHILLYPGSNALFLGD